ncbi:hypothetical protein RSOLAG22IIIB_05682 [Rhizoctonia solani]|uniref:Uncharacterized protein n=1 Tax=Rhizoctonia solani TaxID=456999 RepID=A0A0K6G8Q0_9AGAM|nr:hypothetical protein RSOLAG22IIIB_05682 [Rhizoctonia solani]
MQQGEADSVPGNDDDIETSRSGVSVLEPRSVTGDSVWLRRIREHKDLTIPKKYNIPAARLWSVGFYRLLESLRQASSKSPAAFERVLEYIYYAYGFYSCLFEDDSLSSFHVPWMEALGGLAHYHMVVAAHLASAPVATQQAFIPLRSAMLAVPPPSMNLDPSPPLPSVSKRLPSLDSGTSARFGGIELKTGTRRV